MNLKSKKGFTLVELIIVIAILGIIALIAVPSLTGIQQRSKVNADIRTAEQIGKAVRIWMTDTSAEEKDTTRRDSIKTAVDYSTLEEIGQYISTEYTAKSFFSETDGGKYFVQVVKLTSDTTNTDWRIVVRIGAADAATQYVSGETAGIAYVEGASSLADGIKLL
ncbi:MAG: prepilin-type N-terminal cleavage/methylation domain-containing protein [Clostridiales bacterium]|nr:prepilin-type N-terminal cleavage/methylation domain-containing protein [Clostridiales bacterium]